MITLYRNVVGKLETQDRRRGKMFLCPSHDDSDPSLSVNEGRDGIALVKCHAGCAFQDIMAALDMDTAASVNGQPSTAVTKEEADQALRNRGLRSDTIAYFRIEFKGRDAWTFPLGSNKGVKLKYVRSGKYKNPFGESATTYHLVPCCGAEVAWLLEGEPDVWIGHQAGLKAFSFTTGANTTPSDAILDEITAATIGTINVCYDHDDAGREGAKTVSDAFTRAGITHTVRDIGGLVPPGGDITTLYNTLGGEDATFRETLATLPELDCTRCTLTEPVFSVVQVPTLHAAALYGPLGELVQIIEPITEASAACLLAHSLIYVSNVVGRTPHFWVGRTCHHVNENGLVVGSSAAAKGTADDEIGYQFREVAPEWSRENIIGGLASGEALVREVSDRHEVEGKVIWAGVEDKRKLLRYAEFAGLLQVLQRDGNTLSTVLRDAWDGNVLHVRTKYDPLQATGAHLSVIAHCTPEELLTLHSRLSITNGLLNRWLFFVVERDGLFSDPPAIPTDQATALRRTLERLLIKAEGIGQLHRDADAAALWAELYPSLRADRPGIVGALTKRGPAHCARLQCLYALADGSATIRREHVEAAQAVWSYCDQSVQLLFGGITGDRKVDRLVHLLEQAPDQTLSLSEIYQALGRHRPAEPVAERAVGLGRVEIVEETTGGRTRKVVRLKRRKRLKQPNGTP